MEDIEAKLACGIDRVIIGTKPFQTVNLLNVPLINTAKIVIGIDAKDGMVAIEGWEKQAILPLLNLQRNGKYRRTDNRLYGYCNRRYTCRSNVNAMAEMASAVNADIIASGGVEVLTTSSHLLQQVLRVLSLVRHFIRIRLI